ncbi:MAG: nuclease-related domain-containing protein [Pseudohongiella sp.]|nr:nuclease-related domain-containing protein [Pseudohongiella sp.]MDP2127384.1 nuclease-related domain-containing protein [Pseudohongiella sp.]
MESVVTVIQTVFSMWYLLPIVCLILIIKTPWFKGKLGEFFVNQSIKWMLDGNRYYLLKNVTLPTADGTTQIDHIILSTHGVFVIETKNMKGWIFGGQHQRLWTQKIYRYSKKFQNPLHQNYKHIKTLEALLGLTEKQLHSVIVFVGDSTFKTHMPENVTHGSGLISFIKSKTETVLTESQVFDIAETIESGRLEDSFRANRAHIEHIKSIVASKE